METTTLGAIAAAGVAAGGIAVCFAGNGEELLRPPGASDEADFRARCIKCGRCLEAMFLPGDSYGERANGHRNRNPP